MRAIILLLLCGSLIVPITLASDQKRPVHATPEAPTASSTAKPAWEWTLEERIAVRTNGERARERVRYRDRTRTTAAPAAGSETRATVDAFSGKTHPELFLPHEVFGELVDIAFITDTTGPLIRKGLMPEVRQHGLPADFWLRLESISAPYLADIRAVRILITTARADQSDNVRHETAVATRHADLCRSRAAALKAARNEFGPERLDRFMYEVIAVNMFISSDLLSSAELLRHIEGGCV
ncbi:MAG TPA: hypothetical protein VF618_27860 [Thermoanaerobaculia bacterium]